MVRAKNRLEEAEKEVVAITEKRDGLRAELATSEERLARLRQDVSLQEVVRQPRRNWNVCVPWWPMQRRTTTQS